MKISRSVAALACAALPLFSQSAAADPDAVAPEAVVNSLEGVYGAHAGVRRNHAKGVCAEGSFTGATEAARYSRSALFTGASIPVIARFSLAGGNPEASDADRSPRGMALEMRLPDGGRQHMTMIDTPTFFAAMPKTFLDRFLALKPDPKTGKPDPAALAAFAASHPESSGQAKFLADHNPPPSYANRSYFGIHTFRFLARDGAVTLVKWRFVPDDGDKLLSDAELAAAPHDFLEQALSDRVKTGPIRWQMRVTLGHPGDAEDDPTVAWPADRQEIRAGTLAINAVSPSKPGSVCWSINYDPLIMSDGIAPTKDPVLLFRSPSYAISVSRRLSGN